MLVIKLLYESLIISITSLISNKLRTILSLLGITIGIFSIISVMATIDSLEKAIQNNLNTLGNKVIYIQKWPWLMTGEYPWWKYYNRPISKLSEVEKLKKITPNASNIAYISTVYNKSIKYKDQVFSNADISMISEEYNLINTLKIEDGRYFNDLEFKNGQNVAIVGYDIIDKLFSNENNPIGQDIKISGHKVKIIGILKKEGNSMFNNNSQDNIIYLPVQFGKKLFNINYQDPYIIVKANDKTTNEQLIDELTISMRTIRSIKPSKEDNFSLNQLSFISNNLKSVFRILDIVGIIIGGFAIIVGGFGIANIMFVSVKERTKEIGIQKAIGAKSYLILVQFLSESVALSLIGGIVGLLLVQLLLFIASSISSFPLNLSIMNIVYGTLVSIVIGLISGFIPALNAAKLDPVKAINHI